MFRERATIGVEQKRPMFTPFTPNFVSSVAIAKSQVETSWHPAAVAIPVSYTHLRAHET